MKARILVGRNIRRLRVARQLPQEGLGVAAGIEPSYVGRIERGGENVGVDLLEALATALGVEIADLFARPAGELVSGLQPGRKARVRTAPTAPAPVSDAPTMPAEAPPEPASPSPGADESIKGAEGILKPLTNEVSESDQG